MIQSHRQSFSIDIDQQLLGEKSVIMRINEIPDIERRIIETDNTSTGAGELGLAMVAPSIAHGVFNAIGERIRHMPLITHNCKYRDYADEAVLHRKDGTLYFPAYGGCVTVMGLNNHALPYNSLMLKQCNIDQGFLKATKFQKFTLNKNQQVQLNGTNLCLMAGNQSEETFNGAHRWRSLYMQYCAIAEKPLSQWHFVKP